MAGNHFRRYVLTVCLIAIAAVSFANAKKPSINKHNLTHAKYTLEEYFLYGPMFSERTAETTETAEDSILELAAAESVLNERVVLPSIESLIDLNEPVAKSEIQQSMPLIINGYVTNYINYMSTSKLEFIKASVRRGSPYLKEMKAIFREYGIPEDLVYLPVIESGFKNYAYSSAKAVGMWQFIPDTAKWIGINVNSWIDERRDPIIACRYAAKYLKFLYDVFEDWYLVLAAYNHGGFNIKKELKSIGSIEYYDLVRTKVTPAETRGYVPSLMAVLYILKHHDEYGIDMPNDDGLTQDYDYVHVPFMAQSSMVAKYCGITAAEFNNLNPALSLGFTPDKKYKYKVRVPKNKGKILTANMDKLKSNSYSNYISYYVKSGDSLSGIAYKYGVSMNVLMKINNITNANKIKINQRIFIPKNA